MFPVQPDDFLNFRHILRRKTGIPNGVPYPFKQPGIDGGPQTVENPPSSFFRFNEPGLLKDAHVAGDGRGRKSEEVPHIADAEFFRVHERQEGPEPVLFAECL